MYKIINIRYIYYIQEEKCVSLILNGMTHIEINWSIIRLNIANMRDDYRFDNLKRLRNPFQMLVKIKNMQYILNLFD